MPEGATSQSRLRLAPAADAAPSKFASFLLNAESTRPAFKCTFKPYVGDRPWQSDPYPKQADPNKRSGPPGAKPLCAAAFLPSGKSGLRVRSLLRQVLDRLRAKLAADWPRAVFTLAATKDDRIRVVFNAESVAREHGAGLRAYLRHVILDDRMLDRQVRFQSFDGPGADAPDDVAALFKCTSTKAR
ncbi:hypothetical protein M885DRAFT_509343 [Pelagophyceae sp. CCMP2097]|nr:hypothetical protein M885DRAFT_509343 [Pelagophyceae sp. CCMP2097]